MTRKAPTWILFYGAGWPLWQDNWSAFHSGCLQWYHHSVLQFVSSVSESVSTWPALIFRFVWDVRQGSRQVMPHHDTQASPATRLLPAIMLAVAPVTSPICAFASGWSHPVQTQWQGRQLTCGCAGGAGPWQPPVQTSSNHTFALINHLLSVYHTCLLLYRQKTTYMCTRTVGSVIQQCYITLKSDAQQKYRGIKCYITWTKNGEGFYPCVYNSVI